MFLNKLKLTLKLYNFTNVINRNLNFRCISLNHVAYKKIFQDTENQFAHNSLLINSKNNYNLFKRTKEIETINYINSSLIDESVVKRICETKNWLDLGNDEILEDFRTIGHYCRQNNIFISDERFDGLIDALTEKVFSFSDEQITQALEILRIFPETATVKSRNFIEIWSALDDVCCERVTNWQTDQLLLVFDYWYNLHLGRLCKYTIQMLRKIDRKLSKLTAGQLVQSMFAVNISRKPVINMFKFELQFIKHFDELTIDEIAIIGMGFFKTETKLKNSNLVSMIYQKLIEHVETIQDIPLVNILKILRYSSGLNHADILLHAMDNLTPYISRFSLVTCLHVALSGSDIQVCHEKSFEMVMQRYLAEIKTTRLKDLERISFLIGLYRFGENSKTAHALCISILNEIKGRVNEIIKHPKCLPSAIHHLSISNIYSEEMISSALDSKFIESTYGRNLTLGRELFALDGFTRINLRSTYKGNQLPKKALKTLTKMFNYKTPAERPVESLSATDRLLLNVQEHAELLYKSNPLAIHLMPHCERNDIVIGFNTLTKTPIKLINPIVKSMDYYAEIITPQILVESNDCDVANTKFVVLVIGGWNNFIRNQNRMTGSMMLKMNQLKLLGYSPVLVPWFEWLRIMAREERIKYLQNKINVEIDN